MPAFFTNHPARSWLLGGFVTLLLLLAAVLLVAPRLLTSSTVKQKIQAMVTAKTGGELDFQAIDLNYLPTPGVELQEVRLNFPDQAQGSIDAVRIIPELLPLLRGEVRLSSLTLDSPQLSLSLPAAKADAPSEQPLTMRLLQDKIQNAGQTLGPMLSDVEAIINNGQFTLNQDNNKLMTMTRVNLEGDISATDGGQAQAQLTTSLAELNIFRQDEKQTIKEIRVSGSARSSGDTMQASLDQLVLGEPHLSLNGELSCSQAKPNCKLELTGKDIDVAAVRATALGLADNTTPIEEIFNYLRGGQIVQIHFSSQADQLAGLGEFTNMLIKGQLQDSRIAIPEIKLELSEVTGEVVIDKGILQGNTVSARLKNSTAKDGSVRLGLTEDSDVFQLEMALDADLAEIYSWLTSVEGVQDQLQVITAASGYGKISTLKLQGALDKPAAWKIHSTGTVQKIAVKTTLFPDTINIASGQYSMDPNQLALEKVTVGSLDAAFTVSGSIKGLPQQLQRLDLRVDGSIGNESYTWLESQLNLPDTYRINTPFTISDSKISWQAESTTSFSGQVKIDNGPTINADVDYAADRLQIHQLTIKDQYSDASMVLDLAGDQRKGSFTGRLQHKTLQSLFVDSAFISGQLDGDLAASVDSTGQPATVTVKGQLSGDNLLVPLPSGDQVHLEQAELQGDGTDINVDIGRLTWEILTWSPVKANIFFDEDSVKINIIEAGLCGIDSPATITTNGTTYSVEMLLSGQSLNVDNSYNCLSNGEVRMTGTLNFSSQITAKGQADRLLKRMHGPLQMTFSNGVIKQNKRIARVLEVLNITEIIKGRLPDLKTKGFAYNTMTVEGEFGDGRLTIDNYYLDGETLDLIGQGKINLLERTIDMQILASPLQTVDSIIKNIPGVNYLLAGSLISIPVSISGEITDPKVKILSPSAVSSSVFDLAKRTLKAPFKLLDALNPWSNSQD